MPQPHIIAGASGFAYKPWKGTCCPAIGAPAGWGYLRLRREGYTKAKLRAWTKASRELVDLTATGG